MYMYREGRLLADPSSVDFDLVCSTILLSSSDDSVKAKPNQSARADAPHYTCTGFAFRFEHRK